MLHVNLENSGTHVLWGDLEVEGFVENLFFSSTISDRCVTGINYQLEELVIGLTKGSFYGLCQGLGDLVLTGLWSLKVLLVW